MPDNPRVELECWLDSMSNDDEMRHCRVILDILKEGERASEIHGTPSANPLRCAGIVVEEAGEAMEAALMLTAINPAERRGRTQMHWLAEMRKELIETASSALRRVFVIDSGEMTQWIIDNPTQS
jgi:hypothetical protein